MHRTRAIAHGAILCTVATTLSAALPACSPQAMPAWSTPAPWTPPPASPIEFEPPISQGTTSLIDLSLVEAVRLAFLNNPNLRVRRVDPDIAKTQIQLERAAFDPLISASLNHNDARTQVINNRDPDVNLLGQVSKSGNNLLEGPRYDRSTRAGAGIEQLLPTGTRWNLAFDWLMGDSKLTSPNHLNTVRLGVVQPLLRGFGPAVNLTGIELATRNYELSRYQFEQAVMDVAVGVERTYWDLVLAQLNWAVQAELVESGRLRVEKNIKRQAAGVVSRIDISQDEAAVAARREALLRLENQIAVTRLALLRLVNPKAGDPFWRNEVQTYVPRIDPGDLPAFPDVVEVTRTAREHRPELRQAQIGVTISEIQIVRARNALLPQLDIVADWGYTGRNNTYGQSFQDTFDFRNYAFNVGGQFSWAIGNRAAASQFDRAGLERERNRLSITDVERQIDLDIRLALQQLRNSAERYRASLVTEAAQRRTLDMIETAINGGDEKYNEFILLQFQDNLRNARLSVNQSMVDYLRAMSDLRRAEGTILKFRGLELNWN